MADNINISSSTANILTTYVGRGNRVRSVNESSNKLSINGVSLYLRRHSSLNQIARDINAYERRTHVKALVTKYGNQERIILMSKSRTINIVDSSKVLFNLYKNGLISTVNLKNANDNGIINYSIWNGAQLSKSLLSDSTIYLLSGSPQQEREEDQRLAIVDAYEKKAIVKRMSELKDAYFSKHHLDNNGITSSLVWLQL